MLIIDISINIKQTFVIVGNLMAQSGQVIPSDRGTREGYWIMGWF